MSEISIKQVCCTCLSTNRKLYQLCRIMDGINLLYMLLTQDPEAYKEGFYKNTASLYVCWECAAVIKRIKQFQKQACIVQRCVTSIAAGRNDVKIQTLTRLSTTYNEKCHYEFQYEDVIEENFVDCGPVTEIKTESDSDDIPLSLYHYVNDSNDYDSENLPGDDNNEPDNFSKPGKNCGKPGNTNKISEHKKLNPSNTDSNTTEVTKPVKEILLKKRTKVKYSKYYSLLTMSDEELEKYIELRKMYLDVNLWKCEFCIIQFETENEFNNHNLELHTKRGNYSQCDICHSYIEDLPTHRQSHYHRYNCALCIYIAYTHADIVKHLKTVHKDVFCGEKIKVPRRKRKRKELERGNYPCPECEACFLNKDQRWKHIQKSHREGYKCNTCDKRFSFKSNLERHKRIHESSPSREECQICHKMIRVDLVKIHSLIHTDRQKYTCVECDKSFVSRATYESHLKYTLKHATVKISRHKCPSCPKQYRSRRELQDHINYQHKGQAEHKCPVCGKGLATKRCILRHVRRTHEGIKESAKDKICQQCGKAFRDNKGLIEHERVHSGARPLSCAACGRAFRQRAALHSHTRRIHGKQNDA